MYRYNKPKTSAFALVQKLKNEKGIKFNIINEADAADYIKNINNYLRTASYRKNYVKHTLDENKGKYIDLEFAYLTELSTIDMHLRTILFKMSIDIEHAIKTKLIAAVEDNPLEDGYNLVDKFIEQNPSVLSKIEQKSDSVFTGALIEKYFSLCYVFQANADSSDLLTKILSCDCPVWVLVELISFGDTIKLVETYNNLYPNRQISIPERQLLMPVKSLRNACAHNNCLLNNMNVGTTKPNHLVTRYVAAISTIGREERVKKLSCRPFFEIVCLIIAYENIVSPNVKNGGVKLLKDFVNDRMSLHIDYFQTNNVVKTSFDFLKKVLDIFQKK